MPAVLSDNGSRAASFADSTHEERMTKAFNTLLRKTVQEPPAAEADMIDLTFGFASTVGTPLVAADTPPAPLRLDFYCRVSGAFLEETSTTPISGDATVSFEYRPEGGSWTAIGVLAMTGATTASDETLADWPLYFEPGDRLRARLISAASVESLLASLRARKYSEGVAASLGLLDAGGDTVVDGGDTVILRR